MTTTATSRHDAGRAEQPGATAGAALDADHWRQRLTELAAKHGVPGAGLAVLRVGADGGDDAVVEAAHGVLNTATGVEVTTDSAFQIGSISKVWTATVVMQLVDEGRLELDAPLRDVLPELEVADEDVAARVTMRHLLTHTSGIDGDVFTDTGRGDDCVEKYVASLGEVPQNHPLGATFSYCNTGFTIAGRVIEKLTGGTWDAAVRSRLFEPLGLSHASTLPEEAILGRAAVGHVGEPDEEPRPTPRWLLPRSLGPAGLINATALEVTQFARMHLAGGVAADGTRILSAEAVEQMQQPQTELPDTHTLGDSWGLGWILFSWDGHRLIGHDGNTLGQAAFLRVLPEAGLAVALLTNGGHAGDLFDELYAEVFDEVGGLAKPGRLQPADPAPEVDLGKHVGVYERTSVRTEVLERDGGLVLRTTSTDPLIDDDPENLTHEYALHPVTDDLYVMRPPATVGWIPVTFYSLDDGTPYLHYGARANPKRS
ncbi:CubicO group peptidase (beta-lactamase class C family) [Terracoccus luteus]|uniref:CubicO group peptidase (Beta-lactamase class C family) n=1 Tax=Terracoccus luteus TaxID=53356 RepID=A0A495XQE4_9MICO|nr:serine hydrolase domain-containing protein [Terracoccus luteus]RKT76740.1 CubicO group peptidase (beta-lactamase class C family) [Terracoccus luteus]